MGSLYLLDTSVFSQPIRPEPVPSCQTRWRRHGDDRLAVPAMAIAELEYGLFLRNSEKLWEAYRKILKGRLQTLEFGTRAASVFGEMKARQRQLGKPVDDFDLAIAAVAVSHDLIVATLNLRHFKLIAGLKWEDWSKS
ncbi:MAG: type II toxin-antitoxin system VapC family toxin [Opitutales bacterium]|nr:type II toxin-antitoxin system VapC family toxin [Opitutales bacterium]